MMRNGCLTLFQFRVPDDMVRYAVDTVLWLHMHVQVPYLCENQLHLLSLFLANFLSLCVCVCVWGKLCPTFRWGHYVT